MDNAEINQLQADISLDASTENDTALDSTGTTDQGIEDALEPRESQSEMTDDQKAIQRMKTLEGQVSSFEKKLTKGEIQYKDVPDYLKPYIQNEDKPKPQEVKAVSKDDIEAVLMEKEDQKNYQELVSNINELSIKPDEKDQLVAKYQKYITKGFSKGEALREAYEYMGLHNREKPSLKSESARSARMPNHSTSSHTPVYTYDEIGKMSQAEYDRIKDMEERGEVIIK